LSVFTILIAISESVGFYIGDPDSAVCTNLLKIAQQLRNDSLLAISYNIIGQYISMMKGDNATGLEYFFKAIPLAEKAHDKRRPSSIYFEKAIVHSNLQNNEEYGKYIRKGGENLPDNFAPVLQFYAGTVSTWHDYLLCGESPTRLCTGLCPTAYHYQPKNYQSDIHLQCFFLNGAVQNKLDDKEMAALYF